MQEDFVDTYNTGAVIEMGADSGVQPDPNPASMTYNKYFKNIELQIE